MHRNSDDDGPGGRFPVVEIKFLLLAVSSWVLLPLLLSPAPVSAETPESAADREPALTQPDWQLGYTRQSVVRVYDKDPAGELEEKTTWLTDDERGLVGRVDREELECPMYCVVKFLAPAVYDVTMTCHTDGNHQVLAFSPQSKSFKRVDSRGTPATRQLVVTIDAADSPYLVFTCTDGTLFVDAVRVNVRHLTLESAQETPVTR